MTQITQMEGLMQLIKTRDRRTISVVIACMLVGAALGILAGLATDHVVAVGRPQPVPVVRPQLVQQPVVKLFYGGRFCTGLLGNQRPDGQWSVTVFITEQATVRLLEPVGKGLQEGRGIALGIVKIVPQAELWPGGNPSHGVFFVNYGDQIAEAELREWLREKATSGS